jgi:hypothetical protein
MFEGVKTGLERSQDKQGPNEDGYGIRIKEFPARTRALVSIDAY